MLGGTGNPTVKAEEKERETNKEIVDVWGVLQQHLVDLIFFFLDIVKIFPC